MPSRPRISRVLAAVIIGLMLARLSAQGDAETERYQRVADILKALEARPGARIADVGAGEGFYSVRIARAVLPDGRAVAEDIDEKALKKLRDQVKNDGLTNLEVVTGSVSDPGLEAGAFDAILVHNAYHEFAEHDQMLQHIFRALKPAGRFVLIEPFHDSSKGLSREEQTKRHNLSADIGEQELRAAGFEIVGRDNEFVKFAPVAPGAFWMIVARRPSTFSLARAVSADPERCRRGRDLHRCRPPSRI